MVNEKQANCFANDPDLVGFIDLIEQISLIDFSHYSKVKESLKEELLSHLHCHTSSRSELDDDDLDWVYTATKEYLPEGPQNN